jgi:hypothetical protein
MFAGVFVGQRLEARIFAQRIPSWIKLEDWDRETPRFRQQFDGTPPEQQEGNCFVSPAAIR